MIQHLSRLGEYLFPERHITIHGKHGIRQFRFTSSLQASAVALAIGAVGLTGTLSYNIVQARRAANHQHVAEMNAVKSELAEAQDEAASIAQRLAALATDTGETSDPNADPSEVADKIEAHINDLQQQVQAVTDQQKALEANKNQLAANDRGKLRSKIDELKLAEERAAQNEREEKLLASERDKLKQKVTDLERRLRTSALVAQPTAQTAENDDAEEAAATPIGGNFDLDAFLAKLGVTTRHRSAMGGPYIALSGAAPAEPKLDPEARKILGDLPLSAPLDHYTLESTFGVRVDPINGHRSMHTGLDMSAAYRSPVYSTSAGEVVFAGYAAAYGKMIEIDHGHGIHTRYAHLNRLLVNVGQHISKHSEIGLLGSTGRSTGPHVHYEVLVNGAAEDPARFLAAGRTLLPVSDTQ